MTPERERELLRHVPTLGSLDEAHGFRAALQEQLAAANDQMTTAVFAALEARVTWLAKKEGKR